MRYRWFHCAAAFTAGCADDECNSSCALRTPSSLTSLWRVNITAAADASLLWVGVQLMNRSVLNTGLDRFKIYCFMKLFQNVTCPLVFIAILARTASQCRRAFILPIWFFFYSFFFCFSMPNLWGHWTDLNQTWKHIHWWLLFEKFGPNSPEHLPPWAGGKNNTFWLLTMNFDQTYRCNGTWYQQSQRKLSIYRVSYMPQIWWTLVQKRLRTVGEFYPTPKFSHWGTLPALPHGRYITHSRQTLAGTCYVVAQARTTECWVGSCWAMPCI